MQTWSLRASRFRSAKRKFRAINPRVVLTMLTGEELPELSAYARAGLLSITGHPDQAPVLIGGHIIYAATGLWVMAATATAMLVQQMSGKGQLVNVNIQQCFETFLDMAVENLTTRGRATERRGHQRGGSTGVRCFDVDGFWMLSLSDSLERWRTLVDWMQDPVLADDPALANYDARLAQRDMILDRIGTWAQAFSKLELVGQAQSRHIPAAPVSTSLELANDAQLIDRRFLVEVEHPLHGRMLFPRGALATLWDRTLALAPRLGAEINAILTDLGYTPAEQALLFENAVT